ncbi:imidazolonepropionase-like amidohydrolase [Kaistia hirudinis]|uniref:Imidazolonepropionase-like amidohydrolase n=1 Tax=Kaistia hirudinis TaxID=1293440 RepID=A0A840AVS8_9HYPH|nr:amidohydrolase family protein [Kaistia hirudinis]MBB3933782.1 imidazolonepropionase-like amidohydrolase [Kaistia hirudinis]
MPKTEYVITDAKIVDVVAGAIIEGKAVVISGGKIARLADDRLIDPALPRTSLGGRYLSPGLIDCHAHCYIGQFSDGRSVLPSEMTARAGVHLAGMLMRGFTTVRDAGGADYGHKAALEKGLFKGPRLFVAGRVLSQTGGHGDHRGRAETCNCQEALGGLTCVCDGVDEVRKAVRENIRQGVDHIKIMAGGGVSSPGDKLVHPQYSLEEISAIVEEAERVGRYVMAHVYSDIGMRRAVECGVRSIEHGNFISPDTARVMRERNAHLVPTLITYEADAKYGPSFGFTQENLDKNAEVLATGLKSLEIALSAGVNVGYGTDLCWSPKTYQGDGLLIHEKVCGAAEALRHATINNARVVRMEGLIGEISEGAFADLLVVEANPLDSLACFAQHENRVVAVLQSGAAVRDDRALFAA